MMNCSDKPARKYRIVTSFQIEVRAIAEQYDVHARKLARDILQLSTKHLPSLAAIAASPTPLSISTAQLYRLTGNLDQQHLTQITQQLLVDPVVQQAITTSSEGPPASDSAPSGHVVDVFFHPGVTDTLAESVLAGAQMLAIHGLEHVETGHRYVLDRRLSEDDARAIAQAL